MTANPVRPARYRPGKAVAEENSSSGEEDSGDDQEREEQPQALARAPPPKATSFPAAEAKRISNNLQNVDLNQRRKEGEARERARLERERAERERKEREAGFVTESDDDGDLQEEEEEEEEEDDNIIRSRPITSARIPQQRKPASGSEDEDDEDDSSEEESSSSEDEKPTLHRPVFIRKEKRLNPSTTASTPTPSTQAQPDDPSTRRRAQTDAMVQEKLERDAAARLAGKKAWDDDDADIEGAVDDTDGLDPELERQQWVARELSRLKRARASLEEREAEIAEVERRRGLTVQEREREDADFIARQKELGEGKAKAGFMARYHHRGAFAEAGAETGDVEGEARARELAERDLMGAQYEGREGMKEALPEYLQVRDVMMVGRKGRTRYKDLKSEDTGRWGEFGGSGRGRGAFGGDDRFKPDVGGRDGFGGGGATGANAREVGERKRPYGEERGDVKRPRYDDDRR